MSTDEKTNGGPIFVVDNKSHLGDIYNAKEAMSYYNYCDSLLYGHAHNAFNTFASSFLSDYKRKARDSNDTISLIDIGCSYGNSTMSIIDGLSWDEVGQFWKDDSMKLKNKSMFDVLALDISQNALEFGVKRGYYDQYKQCNVNDEMDDDLKRKIVNADILCVYMVFCYFEGDRFQKLVDLFLTNRNKEKYIFYNFTPAFQKMGIIENTPDIYIKKHEKCSIDLSMSMHRHFSEKEKENFGGNFLGNESSNFIFGIKCEAVNQSKSTLYSLFASLL